MASDSVRFVGSSRLELYKWVERLLCHHEYPLQKRRAKGLLRAYIERMSGFSRAQSTRLIGGYVKAGWIAPKPSLRPRFQSHYTAADVQLLASVDAAHERLSGPATRHILKREFEVYGKPGSPRTGLRPRGGSRSSSGWPGSPTATCTTCAGTRATDCARMRRRGPRLSRSGSGASPSPTLSLAFCASIPCIKETRPRARESTTSTPLTRLRSGKRCWPRRAFQRPG